MRHTKIMVLLAAAVLLLTACGAPKDSPATAAPQQTVEATGAPAASAAAPGAAALEQIVTTGAVATDNPFDKPVYDGPPSMINPEATHYLDIGPVDTGAVIHWDLSRLSSTMAYAQLYTMLTEPEQFVGQTVKVRGQYYNSPDASGQPGYHFVIVFDNAACCELGIEFLWTGNHPIADYPQPMSIVEMTGLFDICNDGGERFCVIRVNDLTVVQEAEPPSLTPMP